MNEKSNDVLQAYIMLEKSNYKGIYIYFSWYFLLLW